MTDQLEKDSLDEEHIKINTHTVVGDDKVIETLLVSVDPRNVGCKNSVTPEDFDKEHISYWMRSNYHISNGEIIAQIPRQIKDYPRQVKQIFNINKENQDLKNISIQDGQLKIYYPMESIDKNIVISWRVFKDDWKMKKEKYVENIRNEKLKENFLWSS